MRVTVFVLVFEAAGIFAAAFSRVRLASVHPSRKFHTRLFVSRIPEDEDSSTASVQRLLDAIDAGKSADTGSSAVVPRPSATAFSSLFRDVEEVYRMRGDSGTVDDLFRPLLGLYDVAYVQTEKEGDNPVGGKWTRKGGVAQRILSTRRAFQHLLPTNSTGLGRAVLEVSKGGDRSVVAEAVNVISLEALFGLVRLTVILRGDAVAITPEERVKCEERQAQRIRASKKGGSAHPEAVTPLSARTVRAYFDAPRIVLGRKGRIVNVNIGPMSDVVLDTTYCDDRIRVGKGGNSGTRFLFKRCVSDDPEANEWKYLLARHPLRKWKALWALGTVAGLGFRCLVRAGGLLGRVSGLLTSLLATVTGAAVLFSAGGIEKDDFVAT